MLESVPLPIYPGERYLKRPLDKILHGWVFSPPTEVLAIWNLPFYFPFQPE